MSSPNNDLFAGVVVYFVEFGIGKVQLDVLRKHVTNKGGKLSSSLSSTTTHIITKLDYSKLSKHLKWTEGKETPPIHAVSWITETLRRGTRAGDTEFLVYAPSKKPLSDGPKNIFDTPKKHVDNYPKNSSTLSRSSTTSLDISRSHHSSTAQTTVDKHLLSHTKPKFSPTNKKPDTNTNNNNKNTNNTTKNNSNTSISTEKRHHSSLYDSDTSVDDHHASKKMKAFNWDNSSITKDSESENESSTSADQLSFEQSWLSYDSSDSKSDSNHNCSVSLNDTVPMSPSSISFSNQNKLNTSRNKNNNNNGHDDNDDDDNNTSAWDSPNRIVDDSDDFSFPPLSPISTNPDDDSPFPFGSEYVKNDIAKVKPQRKKIDRRQFFVCQNSIVKDQKVNHNKEITDILQRLEETAESTGDKWRSYAYRKAVTILKNLPYKITSSDQVKSVKGIGNRIAEKIREIIETGKLRKAEVRDPMTDALKLFSNVFGAGPETVKKWYAQGYRTLQDVQKAPSLNHQQTVGLKYYQEFLLRIPREEVSEIEAKILKVAQSLDPNIRITTCGSYRRGKPDCGDIDILISQLHPTAGYLKQLVDQLHKMDIITDHLTSSIVDKYMGVCRLNSHSTHRRIDLRLIPLAEWPCALLYFTGSDHFNRSMRLWARKHGYSLNEHAVVQRWGRLNRYEVKGEPLAVTTEEDVFRILGLDYREPKDRDV